VRPVKKCRGGQAFLAKLPARNAVEICGTVEQLIGLGNALVVGASIPSEAPEELCLRCLVREGAASRKRAHAPAPPLPNRFGDYEILGELGRGGMGRVLSGAANQFGSYRGA
jgi:hypothetical protein